MESSEDSSQESSVGSNEGPINPYFCPPRPALAHSSMGSSLARHWKWLRIGLFVKINGHEGRPGEVSIGLVDGVNWGAGCSILQLQKNSNTEKVYAMIRDLEPVVPNIGSTVLILNGDFRGEVGIIEKRDDYRRAATVNLLHANKILHTGLASVCATDYQGVTPIICRNIDANTCPAELAKVFKAYGRVEKIYVKNDSAYVYMDDFKGATIAIQNLDGKEFGKWGRKLRVTWDKEKEQCGTSSKPCELKPTKTYHTSRGDLQYHEEEQCGTSRKSYVLKPFCNVIDSPYVYMDDLKEATVAIKNLDGKESDDLEEGTIAIKNLDEKESAKSGTKFGVTWDKEKEQCGTSSKPRELKPTKTYHTSRGDLQHHEEEQC